MLMKLLSITLLLSLAVHSCNAQGGNTTVTAIVKDPNNNLYTKSQVSITFYDPGTAGKLPLLNGSTFQKSYTIYATDSFGAFSVSLPDNGIIDSSSGTVNTQWNFSICYSDRVTCFTYRTPINCSTNTPAACAGSVMDISVPLKSAAAPIVNPLSVLFTTLTSQSPSPAQTGSIRLAFGNTINWRNFANTADLKLLSTVANGNIPVDTLVWDTEPGGAISPIWGFPIIASSGNLPATAGSVRLGSGDTVSWRNNANSANVALSKDASDNLAFPNGLSLGGDSAFSASPRGTFTAFFPGVLTSTWTAATWVLTKPITATQVRVQVKTAPVGCAPNAVIRITDGGTFVDTSITGAANGGAIGTSWGAPNTLTIAITTAAAGCGTAPADAVFTMEYRTQ